MSDNLMIVGCYVIKMYSIDVFEFYLIELLLLYKLGTNTICCKINSSLVNCTYILFWDSNSVRALNIELI